MSISVDSLKKELEAISEIDDSIIISSVNDLNKLVSENTKTWSVGTSSCKNLADSLRSASFRSPLGESGIIQVLSTLLQQASGEQVDFQVQALRVLGNLCFDHAENRSRVKEAGIIPVVSTYLGKNDDTLARTVCGFLLNSSMDYAPILNEIATTGAANGLLGLVRPDKDDDGSITMALKILDNLAGEDEARKVIGTPETVNQLLAMMSYLYKSGEYVDDLDNLENIVDVLLQLIMDDDALQNAIVDMGYLGFLLEFLEKSDIEMEEKEDKEKLEEIRRTSSKITVYATSTDSKMNELYNNHELLSRFLTMAKSESEVVHQCAVYILGNLARSDEHCIELVEKYHLSSTLLKLYQTTENATFQYAILGCLKHLCLPVSNKDIIGNEDCIRILCPALEESKDMLKRNQFLTIGIIKLLCAGNYKNAQRVVEETNALSLVVDFVRRVDDVAAKSEGTRVLTNLVKTIWVQEDSENIKNKVIEAHVIEPIVELVRTSTFPILKNDGIMALTLIFSTNEANSVLSKALPLTVAVPTKLINQSESDEKQEKFEDRTFLQVIVDDICNKENDIPVQIKCNACVLLCKIVESARQVPGQEDIINTTKLLALDRLQNIENGTELYTYGATLSRALQQ